MSNEGSMPPWVAEAIVRTVANDAACRECIPPISAEFIALHGAGGLRNFINMAAEGAAWLGGELVQQAHDDLHHLAGLRVERVHPYRQQPTEAPLDAAGYAKDYWRKKGAAQDCYKIATVTAAAINAAIKAGTLPDWVTKAWQADRVSMPDNHVLAAHCATAVQVTDGSTYVFDWHGTLQLCNPLISRRLSEWLHGDDRHRVEFNVFQGWS